MKEITNAAQGFAIRSYMQACPFRLLCMGRRAKKLSHNLSPPGRSFFIPDFATALLHKKHQY
jgi:hypothetical protein